MLKRRTLIASAGMASAGMVSASMVGAGMVSAGLLAAPGTLRAQTSPAGKGPIRVGEINSYSAIPSFTLPYRNGWAMAVEEINAAGGVLGRPLEVISRDDTGKQKS